MTPIRTIIEDLDKEQLICSRRLFALINRVLNNHRKQGVVIRMYGDDDTVWFEIHDTDVETNT